MNATAADASTPENLVLCAVCQSPFREGEEKAQCPACHAEYHADCWAENGGCAIYGCAEVPKIESRTAIEIPVGYWGQENKPCPVCNQMILAAAVRCRYCGSVFQTAKPLDSGEFTRSALIEAGKPAVRKKIIWCFVLCLIPITAPIVVVILFFWSRARRTEIQSLPSLYPALVKIALLMGLAETIAVVLVALLHGVLAR